MTSQAPLITAVGDLRDELGEGPHWDAGSRQLIHVDITRGLVYGLNPETGQTWRIAQGGEVSAAIPCRDGGFLLANGHELVIRSSDSEPRIVASVERGLGHTRFNECRCDPRGTLWAGTMSRERRPRTGALYRLAPGGTIERVVTGTTISNGLGWSPEADRMYFIDSLTYRIDVFDYDLSSAELENRRTLASVDSNDGLPDGLTVDAEGCIWVCLFGGAAVRRYAADGSLMAHVSLPVTNPTCPAFGGADLATLYITSARHRLTAQQLAAEPLAGALLSMRLGVSGVPGHAFGAGA
jgi:sugar lactone lactonase YvrE